MTGHLGGRCGFINEDKSFRIKGRLCYPQGPTGGGDIISILFGRVDTFLRNGDAGGWVDGLEHEAEGLGSAT